jgi:hypothetical protein
MLSMETIYFSIVIVVLISCAIFLHKSIKSTTTRRYLKDVKPGEQIQIEWNRAEGGLCTMKCLNNDPKSKVILLEIRWSNYKEVKGCSEYQKLVLDYDDDKLKNFHLLNTYEEPKRPKQQDEDIDDIADTNIAELQKKMNEALAKEEYEKADIIQKKINKLLKKK